MQNDVEPEIECGVLLTVRINRPVWRKRVLRLVSRYVVGVAEM